MIIKVVVVTLPPVLSLSLSHQLVYVVLAAVEGLLEFGVIKLLFLRSFEVLGYEELGLRFLCFGLRGGVGRRDVVKVDV